MCQVITNKTNFFSKKKGQAQVHMHINKSCALIHNKPNVKESILKFMKPTTDQILKNKKNKIDLQWHQQQHNTAGGLRST